MTSVPTLAASMFNFNKLIPSLQYVADPGLVPVMPGSARIIVVRPSIFGGLIKIKIDQDQTRIGLLGPKGFLRWDTPADQDVRLTSRAENTSVLDLRLQGGQTYYVHQEAKFGLLTVRTAINLMDSAIGQGAISGLPEPRIGIG